MSATRWWWLVGAMVVAPACRGTVAAERQTDDSTGGSSAGSGGSSSGGSGGSSSGGGTSSSSGGGGDGSSSYDDGAAPPFCTYTVSGAMEFTGTGTYPSYYGSFGCDASVGGGTGYFSVDLSMVHGPGSYPLVGAAGLELQSCPMNDEGCTEETFSSSLWSCAAEITVAPPVLPTFGERLAGSVWCASLVDQADATQTLAVTSSFSLVMMPPPCRVEGSTHP